jgi:hypothetical protein
MKTYVVRHYDDNFEVQSKKAFKTKLSAMKRYEDRKKYYEHGKLILRENNVDTILLSY